MAQIWFRTDSLKVALHPEGVDRNYALDAEEVEFNTSPSTRRAWIEIYARGRGRYAKRESPSTRRAWIEIRCRTPLGNPNTGRPPPGGRG